MPSDHPTEGTTGLQTRESTPLERKPAAIYAALAGIQEDLNPVPKNQSTGKGSWGYNFRGIDQVQEVFWPLFRKHKVGFSCVNREVESREIQVKTKNGIKTVQLSQIVAWYNFVSLVDGSTVTTCTSSHGSDDVDKGLSGAGSTAYRYALLEFFCVPCEGIEDNDQRQRTLNAQPQAPPNQAPPQDDHQAAVASCRSAIGECFGPKLSEAAINTILGAYQVTDMKFIPDLPTTDIRARTAGLMANAGQ